MGFGDGSCELVEGLAEMEAIGSAAFFFRGGAVEEESSSRLNFLSYVDVTGSGDLEVDGDDRADKYGKWPSTSSSRSCCVWGVSGGLIVTFLFFLEKPVLTWIAGSFNLVQT